MCKSDPGFLFSRKGLALAESENELSRAMKQLSEDPIRFGGR